MSKFYKAPSQFPKATKFNKIDRFEMADGLIAIKGKKKWYCDPKEEKWYLLKAVKK